MKLSASLRQQIDACCNPAVDLELPELAELKAALAAEAEVFANLPEAGPLAQEIARSQQFDALVRQTLWADDLALPAGLEDRLLEAASRSLPPAEYVDSTTVSLAEKPAQGRWTRRMAWSVPLAMALSLGLLVAFFQWMPAPQRQISKDQLAGWMEGWLQTALPATGWRDDVSESPDSFPRDSAVRGKIHHWQKLVGKEEPEVVVYDLTPAGQAGRALLFVVQTDAHYDVASSPVTRLTSSGRMRMIAWQKKELLFVLAVQEEDDQRIEHFLKQQELTMAD